MALRMSSPTPATADVAQTRFSVLFFCAFAFKCVTKRHVRNEVPPGKGCGLPASEARKRNFQS